MCAVQPAARQQVSVRNAETSHLQPCRKDEDAPSATFGKCQRRHAPSIGLLVQFAFSM